MRCAATLTPHSKNAPAKTPASATRACTGKLNACAPVTALLPVWKGSVCTAMLGIVTLGLTLTPPAPAVLPETVAGIESVLCPCVAGGELMMMGEVLLLLVCTAGWDVGLEALFGVEVVPL